MKTYGKALPEPPMPAGADFLQHSFKRGDSLNARDWQMGEAKINISNIISMSRPHVKAASFTRTVGTVEISHFSL